MQSRSGRTSSVPGLRELAERHPVIGEVRGFGVFWALDLVRNRADPRNVGALTTLLERPTSRWLELVTACKQRGLMPFVNYNRLHVVPPCTVSETEAKEGLGVLDESFSAIASYYSEAHCGRRIRCG